MGTWPTIVSTTFKLTVPTDYALFQNHRSSAARVPDLPVAKAENRDDIAELSPVTKAPEDAPPRLTGARGQSRKSRGSGSTKSIFQRLPLELRQHTYAHLADEHVTGRPQEFLRITCPDDYELKMWFADGYESIIAFPIEVLSVGKQMQDEVLEVLCRLHHSSIFAPYRVWQDGRTEVRTVPLDAQGNKPEEMDIRTPHTYVPG